MVKEIMVIKFKCEKCGTLANEFDKFCSECGNDLKLEIIYKELPKSQNRDYSYK